MSCRASSRPPLDCCTMPKGLLMNESQGRMVKRVAAPLTSLVRVTGFAVADVYMSVVRDIWTDDAVIQGMIDLFRFVLQESDAVGSHSSYDPAGTGLSTSSRIRQDFENTIRGLLKPLASGSPGGSTHSRRSCTHQLCRAAGAGSRHGGASAGARAGHGRDR